MFHAQEWRGRLALLMAIFFFLCTVSLVQGGVAAGMQDHADSDAKMRLREALQDSLRLEIQHYSEMIRILRDSLAGQDQAQLDDAWLADVEHGIASLGGAITSIAEQISALQVEVDAGRFSLRDGRGGRISVELPQDLGERISQGIASITRVILEEIPDTLRFDEGATQYFRHWNGLYPGQVVKPSRPERMVPGDVFKFNDDLMVAADEVIDGNVVVVFGDVVVKGRVQGDLVVVLGSIELQQESFIDGSVVQAFGRLDRHESAQTGKTTVRFVDLREGLSLLGRERQATAWPAFLAWQGMFVLVLCLVVLMLALLPRARIDEVVRTLTERPWASLMVGQLIAIFGHLALIGISALLIVTVIGVPVALIVLLALALVDLAAVGVVSVAIGRYLGPRLGWGELSPWKAAFLGLLALHAPAFLAALGSVVGLAPVLVTVLEWVGRVGKFAALMLGLGALLLGRFGSPTRSGRFPHEAPQATDLNTPLHD